MSPRNRKRSTSDIVVVANRMPVDRVVGADGEVTHHPPLVGGIDAHEVEPPALGNEESESH